MNKQDQILLDGLESIKKAFKDIFVILKKEI